MAIDKNEADIMSALSRWFESQDITPKDAVIAMSGLCAVLIGKIAHSEEDAENGVVACARDMLKLACEAYKLSHR